ncbi:MAG: ABC transporter permease subunit [Gammaproteobacteria bacterium]|nr:ABC transporter permease subunit [Gammaproteobacteria bacterium]
MADLNAREEVPQWEQDLAKVGWVRRALQARRWYKADWWFVAISMVLVVFFLIMAIVPGLFAAHDPREQVGPRLLAPGEAPDVEALVVPVDSGIDALTDLLGVGRVSVGVVKGTPSSQTVRDEAARLTDEMKAQGSDETIRLRVKRYETVDETLAALAGGEIGFAVLSSKAASAIIDQYPGLAIDGPVAGEGISTSGSFPLGTNQLGQDVLSRLIWGTRVAFLIGFAAALMSLVIGLPLGLIAGFAGGWLDRTMSVIMDSLYAFPGLILAIAITAVLGPSIINVIVAIGVVYVPTYYRIVRGQTLSVKEEMYVEAARSIGATRGSILRNYVFPNVIPSVAIIFSVNVADAILTGAGLSFLGLGLPPDTPDWGIDLARGQENIQNAWWMITFPGLAVMSVVLAFTMMGEGLMEIFNPKLRDR